MYKYVCISFKVTFCIVIHNIYNNTVHLNLKNFKNGIYIGRYLLTLISNLVVKIDVKNIRIREVCTELLQQL